ncbi:DUF2829 domain-containing protein [Clostridium butyricum]
MKKYLGTKMVNAEPMNLGNYNMCRGWEIPINENPNREGYKVQYDDGYVSWSPKEIFEEAYIKTHGYDLSWGLIKLKQGKIIARRGWKGKGMYVALAGKEINDIVTIEPFLVIKNTKGTFNTWVPSISDLLADDWEDVTELYSK